MQQEEFRDKKGKYKICRFDIFKLLREEAEYYLRKRYDLSYGKLKILFEDYTKKFLRLYDWDIPEGGAGDNPF